MLKPRTYFNYRVRKEAQLEMGGIAAAVNKEGNDAAAAVKQMLTQLKHRGKGEFHIVTPTSAARSSSLGELETQGIVANTAV